MGRYITTTGTAGTTLREINSNYIAVVNDRILVDTSTSITITLPAAATLFPNDTIQIIDITGNAATNPITVLRNLAKIQNINDDLIIDISGAVITLVYSGATYGWVVASA